MGISSQSAELAKTILLLSKKPIHILYLLVQRYPFEPDAESDWLLKLEYQTDSVVVTDLGAIQFCEDKGTFKLQQKRCFNKFRADRTSGDLRKFIWLWLPESRLLELNPDNGHLNIRLLEGQMFNVAQGGSVIFEWKSGSSLFEYAYTPQIQRPELTDELLVTLECGWMYLGQHALFS